MNIFGIVSKDQNIMVCPLQIVKVDAILDMDIAIVKVLQEYYYSGNSDIEAIYKFPLSPDSQVTDLNIKIGSDEIKGELKQKEEAFKYYEKNIRKGDSAFLLDSFRDDYFQISLGNIKPKTKISIEIGYIENLRSSDNIIRWGLPTTVAPKYKPFGYEISQDLDIEHGEPKYTLEISTTILDKNMLTKISSPSHPLEFSYDNNEITINLSKEIEYLDRDFVLNIYHNNTSENVLKIGTDEEDTFGEFKFVPELDYLNEINSNKDYIFILDISGSMSGEKLNQAKRALNICLSNLLEGDKFNIISFNNDFSTFSNELVNYTDEDLKKAKAWINSIEAYGGTEILAPMDYALNLPKGKDEKIILLFTDGQVYNEDEIVQIINDKKSEVRIYPFGIDTAINKRFIDQLASVGNGMPEYIYPGERIEDKVINQFSRINLPYLTDVTIKNSAEEEIETFPVIPKYLHSGEEYRFMFKLDECQCDYVIVEGKINDEKKSIKVDNIKETDISLLRKKWAKEYIKHLESLLVDGNERREKLLKEDIVNTSIKYGVLSTQTSIVAVYKRKDKNRGHIKTVYVPLNLPHSWVVNDENLYTEELSSNYDVSSHIMYQLKPVAMNKSASTIDITKELMFDIAASQNADGSLGHGDNILDTSYFILAMILYDEESKPYRNQIIKAIVYLLNLRFVGLEIYLPLKLAYENNIYAKQDIVDRIQQIEKDDIQGNMGYLLNLLKIDIEEFSQICFGKALNRMGLIKYLFEQIEY